MAVYRNCKDVHWLSRRWKIYLLLSTIRIYQRVKLTNERCGNYLQSPPLRDFRIQPNRFCSNPALTCSYLIRNCCCSFGCVRSTLTFRCWITPIIAIKNVHQKADKSQWGEQDEWLKQSLVGRPLEFKHECVGCCWTLNAWAHHLTFLCFHFLIYITRLIILIDLIRFN